MPEYRIAAKIDPAGVVSGGKRVRDELNSIDGSAARLGQTLKNVLGGVAVGAAIKGLITLTTEYSDGIAEISTLVDTATFDMEALSKAARDQARAFASTPEEQTKAFYQIISAGATSAAQATETLTAANKLAVGGVTDVATAADGLTSILNAYGSQVASATAVSDALFIAMRAGKTTIAELSANVGKVAPLAAQAGASFDELAASVSALTKGGISTAEAVTGVRAILAAVVKPTSEASELAAKLGINFSAAGLKAKGFAGFLEELKTKTNGNTEQLATLFSGVEALVPILSLSGSQAESFASILEQMGDKAGATEDAFNKLAQSPGFQIGQLIANIRDLALGLGLALGNILVPALIFVNANFEQVAAVVGAVTAGFVAYRAAVLISAAATLFQASASSTLLKSIIANIAAGFALNGVMGATAVAAAAAGGAFRVLSAAIIASPLAPLAIALTVAGAAYLYFTNQTDAATDATAAKTSADQVAAEWELRRTGIIANLANSTAIERAKTVAATRAAIAKASADISAAKSALKRAVAERELAAAILGKEQASQSGIASFKLFENGPSLGDIPGIFGQDDRQNKLSGLAARNTEIGNQITAAEKSLERTKKLADEIENFKPPAAISAPGVGGDGKNKGGRDAAAAAVTTKFSDIEADIKREIELLGLVGVERDVRAEQLRAEDALNRKLTGPENDKIASLVKEADALARLEDFNQNFLGAINDEIDLLGFSGDAREKRAAQLQAEDILKRQLTKTEQENFDAEFASLFALRKKKDAIDAVNGPLDDYREKIEGLNAALAEGSISQAAFTAQVGNIGLVGDLAGLDKDLGGNFARDAELEQVRLREAERTSIIQDAREANLIGEEEYQARLLEIQRRAAQESKDVDLARKSLALTSAGETFDSLASLSKDFFGETSAIYKAMFGISKAFAIADSIIKIQQGIANALSLPFPANIVAAAGVAAQAASIVSNIRAVSLALNDGGMVRGVGSGRSDSIPANLSDGEFVVNARSTAANLGLLESINGAGGSRVAAPMERISQRGESPRSASTAAPAAANVNVPLKVVNILDPSLVLEAMATEAGTRVVINIIEQNPEAIGALIK